MPGSQFGSECLTQGKPSAAKETRDLRETFARDPQLMRDPRDWESRDTPQDMTMSPVMRQMVENQAAELRELRLEVPTANLSWGFCF